MPAGGGAALYVEGDNLAALNRYACKPGALNRYARRPGALTDESEHVGLLFSAHAAIAFAGARAN